MHQADGVLDEQPFLTISLLLMLVLELMLMMTRMKVMSSRHLVPQSL